MRFLILLPDSAASRVTRVVGTSGVVVRARSAAHATDLLTSAQYDGIVFDPTPVRDSVRLEALIGAVERTDTPTLIYSPLSSRHDVACLASGVGRLSAELVLFGVDDELGLLRRRIDGLASASVSALMLKLLFRRLVHLDAPLDRHCVGLFGGHAIPRTVPQFLLEVGRSRSWADASARSQGLRSVSSLLRVARAGRAWEFLQAPLSNVDATAEVCGYGTRRAMEDNFRAISGEPPRRAARLLSAAEFAYRLIRAFEVPSPRDRTTRAEE